jgi:hypothetical protein
MPSNSLPSVTGPRYRSAVSVKRYGAKFRLRYKVSKDRMHFRIIVRHNIDEALIFDGGVRNEIREKLVSPKIPK